MAIRLLASLVVVAVVAAAQAQDRKPAVQNTHEGVVVKAADGKLTMTGATGKPDHTHDVPDAAEITCDGKKCNLADLKPGTKIKVTTKDDGKTVTKIEGSTKKDKDS